MQHPKQLFVVASLDYMHVEAEVRCLSRAVVAAAESEPPLLQVILEPHVRQSDCSVLALSCVHRALYTRPRSQCTTRARRSAWLVCCILQHRNLYMPGHPPAHDHSALLASSGGLVLRERCSAAGRPPLAARRCLTPRTAGSRQTRVAGTVSCVGTRCTKCKWHPDRTTVVVRV